MELYEDLVYSFEQLTDEDNLEDWIELYLGDAYYNTETFNALIKFSQYLKLKSYIEFQIFILETLYKINNKESIAFEISQAYFDLSEIEEAENWLTNISNSNKTYKVRNLKGKIYFESGDLNKAKQIFKSLIQDFPTQVEPYFLLGQIFEYQNNLEQAIYYYKIIYDYFNSVVDIKIIRNKIIELLLQQEIIDYPLINSYLNDVRYPLTTDDEYVLAANVNIVANQYDIAKEFCEKAIEINNENIESRILLLEIYYKIGQKEKFLKQFNWLIENIPPYHDSLCDVLTYIKYIDKPSDNVIKVACDNFELINDEVQKFDLLDTIVDYYLNINKAHEALHFVKMIDDPMLNNINMSPYFAKIFDKLNIVDDAKRNYQLAIDNLVQDKNIVFEYAEFLIKQNEKEHAKILINNFYQTIYDTDDLKDLRNSLI